LFIWQKLKSIYKEMVAFCSSFYRHIYLNYIQFAMLNNEESWEISTFVHQA